MKLFIIVISSLIVSCVSTGPDLSCEGTNWYELGRQAGRQGKSLKDNRDLSSICGQKYPILEIGYFSGLAEFCSSENAFNLGRLNLVPKNQCPESFQKEYQKAFSQGKRYAQIEKTNMETNKKIEFLSDELGAASLSLAKKALREGQRLELLERKGQELSELKTLQESAKLFPVSQ